MNGRTGDPRVSVVVAARDAEISLPALLKGLAAQSLPDFEAIVVDDGSTDSTARLAEASGVARVVRVPEHRGAYAARNLGLAHARASVIATTDSDCRPDPDWLERGLEDLAVTGADLLGGRIEVPLSDRPSVSEVVDAARFLDQRRAVESLGFAATANLFVRREVFDRVGGFDAGLRSGGDLEFTQRAVANGCRLVYSHRATVTHGPRRRARELSRKAFRVGFGHAQLTLRRHGNFRDRPLMWSRPGFYRPPGKLLGAERVSEAGYEPTAPRRAALAMGQYLFVQLPMIAGSIAASAHSRPAR